MTNQHPKINFVPENRRLSRRNFQLIKRWCLVFACVLGVIVLPCLYIAGNNAFTDTGLSALIESTKVKYESKQRNIPVLRARFNELQAEQEIRDLVENRVHWRQAFQILIKRADLQVKFTQFHAIGGGVEGKDPITISMEGYTLTQSIARSYIVNIESTGIFDQVELVETVRVQVDDQEFIRFKARVTVDSTESHLTSDGE